jgi:hypothetical protein
VFSGVLEYIRDIDALLDRLATRTRAVIASYATTDKLSDYTTRRANGWINHFSEAQILAKFERKGFRLAQRVEWDGQVVFEFVNSGAAAPAATSTGIG